MDQPETAAEPRSQVPKRTTPTWEMELLISGATVFGLLQLPPQADRLLFGFHNASGFAVAALTPSLWVYVQFALMTLAATFVLHLCLRGYWIALVGLYSVYPEGFRWDRLKAKLGPHYLDVSRELAGDMDAIIERADNRASIVFGLGFGLAMMMLMPMLLVTGMMVVIWVCEALGGDGFDVLLVMAALIAVLFFVFFGLMMWDNHRGPNIPADSPVGRRMRSFFRFYARLGFDRASNPLITLFGSNEGNRRTALVIGVVMVGVMTIVTGQVLAERLGWGGDYDGLPDDVATRTDVLLPEHYASQRGTATRLSPLPHIPDPVVRGDYLRLFVPYLPMRHNQAMRRLCPEVLASGADSASRERLDCLEQMHAVTLDGEPLDLHFDAAEDPATGQRGMIAMIPVRELTRGRHELRVGRATRNAPKEGEPAPKPYVIPFWR